MNIWYYFGIASTYVWYILPAAGLAAILFPQYSLNIRKKFPIIFIILFIIALLGQFSILVGTGLLGVTEFKGIIHTYVRLAFPLMFLGFIGIFFISVWRQQKTKEFSIGLALFSSLVLAAPLYYLGLAVLKAFIQR